MPVPKRLDARLLSAVPYLLPHASVADIGTDHAYLPIHLVQQGLAGRVLACDIRKGPLSSAQENIRLSGLEDRIGTLLTDGLHGVESFHPDHILIFGMGGELIEKILSEADWIKSSGIRLILQPMSRAEVLRRYLWQSGFSILAESLSRADGRIYQTICAEWQRSQTPFSAADCLVGKPEHHQNLQLYIALIEQKIKTQNKILSGKQKSSHEDLFADRELLAALEARLKELGGAK